MLWHTHLAFGFFFGLLSLPFLAQGNIFVFFLFVLFGALLPDIDEPKSKIGQKVGVVSNLIKAIFGHRGVFHTLFGMALLCGLFWYFVSRTYGAAMAVGFFSHLFADGLTKMGINFLHPVAKLHLSGFIETGSIAETVVFIGVLLLSVLILL